jgi:phosphotransferase system HPr (HPr) family protein
MIEAKAVVGAREGLCMQVCAALVDCANKHKSEITVCNGALNANAQGLLDLMMLGAAFGTELTVLANGSDEESAAAEVCELIGREIKAAGFMAGNTIGKGNP